MIERTVKIWQFAREDELDRLLGAASEVAHRHVAAASHRVPLDLDRHMTLTDATAPADDGVVELQYQDSPE